MFDPGRFDVISFDCYGTLIDWETGIWNALRPHFVMHSVDISKDKALELFGELESAAEAGEYRSYRSVLSDVLGGIAGKLGFGVSADDRAGFAASVRHWPAFADTPTALQILKSRYQLAVISNIDDDLFASSAARLGVPLDWIITAQQVGAYKPSAEVFRQAYDRIAAEPGRVLHAAQSVYHDIAPASALGVSTVWVNRRHGAGGHGATPPASAKADIEVPDLATLAALLAG